MPCETSGHRHQCVGAAAEHAGIRRGARSHRSRALGECGQGEPAGIGFTAEVVQYGERVGGLENCAEGWTPCRMHMLVQSARGPGTLTMRIGIYYRLR